MADTHIHTHTSGPPADTADFWDECYATDLRWSGRPNGALTEQAADLAPGTALDLCCGEGADALWLAGRGWTVTGLDISAVALERAARAASQQRLAIEWICAELAANPPPRQYDLVCSCYPALRHAPGDPAIHAILGAVAPGGSLVMVGHALDAGDMRHGYDPADYVGPADIAAHLRAGWIVELNERRERSHPADRLGPDIPDLVLRARRIN